MSMLLMGCGSAGGFNPLSLNPTLLALPENSFSDNGITPAVDNDPTYFVNDASANDNDLTQVTLASRPLYKSAGYWTFDGVDDFFRRSITYGQEYTVVAVVKATNDTGNENFFDGDEGGAGGGAHRQFQFAFYGTDLRIISYNNVSVSYAANKTVTPSDWNICTGRVSGTAVNVFANGGTPGTATITGTPQSGSGSITLGRYGGLTVNVFAGDFAWGGLWATTALTNEQLNQLGNYLVSQYPSLSLSWTDIT